MINNTEIEEASYKEELENAKAKMLRALKTFLDRGDLSREEVLKVIPGPKGRKVTELPSFTFSGSGITVKVRRLGPFTLDMIRSKLRIEKKPPDPPQVMVNYGDEDHPEFRMETNLADPKYKEALENYEKEIADEGGRKVIDTIIRHAVVVEPDLDEVLAARDLLADMGVPKEELDQISDHEIYVKHVCVKTGEDLNRLQNFVIGMSIPTEEVVKAHEDSFRGEVQGETSGSVQSTIVGNEV